MGFAASSKSSYQTIAYELAARKLEEARGYNLFGGPAQSDATNAEDRYRYFGNITAPNPDASATAYERVNTNRLFRAFSGTDSPDNKFVYRVDCIPVVDISEKYLEFPYREGSSTDSYWRGFATMYRLVVTVRGPGLSPEQASDENWGLYSESCVEAKLSTFVGNNNFGQALLKQKYVARVLKTAGSPASGFTRHAQTGPGEGLSGDLPVLRVGGLTGDYPFPEDFTVLNERMLYSEEIGDSGPSLIVGSGATVALQNSSAGPVNRELDAGSINASNQHLYGGFSDFLKKSGVTLAGNRLKRRTYFFGEGLNQRGLDNVVICCSVSNTSSNCNAVSGPTSVATTTMPAIPKFVAESNKIVDIIPPKTGLNTSNDWLFVLLNDVIARDGDYAQRNMDGTARLMDKTFDGDLYLDSTYKQYGYPAGTSTSGTRVRFLMKLEYL